MPQERRLNATPRPLLAVPYVDFSPRVFSERGRNTGNDTANRVARIRLGPEWRGVLGTRKSVIISQPSCLLTGRARYTCGQFERSAGC